MVPPAGPLPAPVPQRPPVPVPAAQGRNWYQEPAVLGTIIVLAIIVVLFVVLIALAMS
jgi:hypothetical protein